MKRHKKSISIENKYKFISNLKDFNNLKNMHQNPLQEKNWKALYPILQELYLNHIKSSFIIDCIKNGYLNNLEITYLFNNTKELISFKIIVKKR